MKFYFAPLEGISGYVYRNAYIKVFKSSIDKYFAPFISPGVNQVLTPKELRDITPENNKGIKLIPQILANKPEDFLLAANEIKKLGYDEININLGCPSNTVVAKKKGSGFLAYPDELDSFLEQIYSKTNLKISVKTRIGKESPDEFYELLNIYNKYPMEELIIHPRLQKDYYKNTPNMEIFNEAVRLSKNALCYNGDILTVNDYKKVHDTYPNIGAVMIGRGLLRNPMLVDEITNGKKIKIDKLIEFHETILESYKGVMFGEKPVLFKMKELWSYMITLFEDAEKIGKKIRKAEKLSDYEDIAKRLFEENKLKLED